MGEVINDEHNFECLNSKTEEKFLGFPGLNQREPYHQLWYIEHTV